MQTADDCGLGVNPITNLLTKVVAYPNPYSNTLKLAIQTNNTANVDVKVYDMLGRMLEHTVTSFEKIAQIEIGSSYPSRVFNVVVRQENTTKALRVIKQ